MSKQPNYSKKMRIGVQRDTIKYIDRNSRKFKSKIIKYMDHNPPYRNNNNNFKTCIRIDPKDTLDATISGIQSHKNTKVGFLVMANSTNKGGRYLEGTTGQEESICRRTNLHSCFKSMKYPIPEFGSFLVHNISIIRDTESNGYAYFDKPYLAVCVMSAAYHSPPVGKNNRLTDGYRLKTKQKIESILNAFLENNCYNIVLGAYGCGAFMNPTEDIAHIFKEILSEPEYENMFETIVFALLKNAGTKNYEIFKKIFG